MHRINILLFFLLFSTFGFGQTVPLSDKAQISVLTCGTSTEIYALFGHTAIRVNDPENRIDIVYNYGAFDFATPNFGLKFAKGDLQYFVTSSSYVEFVAQYDYEQRSVYEQALILQPTQKQAIFNHLNRVLLSNERYYTYKFIDRNCTNMAADVIENVLGKGTIVKVGATDTTYRKTLYPFFAGHFFEKLGTQILFGTKVDENATTLFLPFELKSSLDKTIYNGNRLAQESKTIMEFPEKEIPFSWWNNIYVLLIVLTIVVVADKPFLTRIYLTLISVVGLLSCYTMLFSLHEELRNNYNILLFNPLILVLLIFYVRKKQKWIAYSLLFCIGLIIVYAAIMIDKAHFPIVIPIIAANLIIFGRLLMRSRKRLQPH